MLIYVRQFFSLRVVSHKFFRWNEVGDSQFSFYISGTSNSLSNCSEN